MRFTRMPASVAIGGAILSAACSGNLLPTSVDGGYGLGSDSGSGVASSSGATSGASSVSLCEQFQQEELQNPMEIACPGGSYVPSMAVAADNGQCLVTYTCPGMPTASFPIQLQPTPSQPSSCTAASPDLCSACLALPQVQSARTAKRSALTTSYRMALARLRFVPLRRHLPRHRPSRPRAHRAARLRPAGCPWMPAWSSRSARRAPPAHRLRYAPPWSAVAKCRARAPRGHGNAARTARTACSDAGQTMP